MSKRKWEKWWEGHAPEDFLRGGDAEFLTLRHTMFKMVADIAREVGGSVLDVGCATCVPYPYFKERGMEYTGLDLTEKFLDHAKILYPEINVCTGNIIDGIYPDNSFDTVICINTFVNFNPREYREILSQLIRISRKQVLIVFEKLPWYKPMTVKKGRHFYTVRYNHDDLVSQIESKGKVKNLRVIKIKDGERMRSEAIYQITIDPLQGET